MFKATAGKHRVLTFHRIVDDDTPLAMVEKLSGELMTQASFADQLDSLQARFNFVTLSEFLTTAATSTVPLATVTFDDGYADNYHNALPVLQNLNIPATCFIISGMVDQEAGMRHHRLARSYANGHINLPNNTRITPSLASEYDEEQLCLDPQDRFLTSGELKKLTSAGISIQAHSITHRPLAELATEEQETELVQSRITLEAIVQQPVKYFAYPIGQPKHFNQSTIEVARQAGYQAAFTTIKEEWATTLDPFALPRWGMRHSARRSLKGLRLKPWQ